MKNLKLLIVITLAALPAFGVDAVVPRIFVESQGGFESYISAALVKKKVPVVVTLNKADASYVITSVLTEAPESTGSKIARCAFIYCAGIAGTQTATIQLVDPKTNEIAFAYNVKKAGAKNYQSSAEAIAKHLKGWLEDREKDAAKKK